MSTELDPWDRPWQQDVKITEGKYMKPVANGKFQMVTGPVCQINVQIPVEEIAKFERYFRTIHQDSAFTLDDVRSKIQDATQYHAAECEKWAETWEEKAKEPQAQAPARYYQPRQQDHDYDRGDDR